MIREFRDRYRFLSNFWLCKVSYEGRTWRSVEHAYQAAKCKLEEDKQRIFDIDRPGEAKRFGRIIRMRRDWEEIKVSVMECLLREKFKEETLRKWLVNTGNQTLEEGNHWHDTFWGVDLETGEGENHLGKLLMKIRREIIGNAVDMD